MIMADKRALDAAVENKASMDDGRKPLVPALDAMATRVAVATERTNDRARELQSKLDAIAKLTNVIRSVASRTKLLALNATIEAARYGEQGRGFGIVASEMRALALQAERGVREIEGCLADAISAASGNDQAIAALSAAVEEGLHIVGQLVAAGVSATEEVPNDERHGVKSPPM